MTKQEMYANARLIAKAPEMKDCIINLLNCLESWVEIAEEHDMRKHDTDAINEATKLLKDIDG